MSLPLPVLNIAFYRFVELRALPELRARFRALCARLELKGTILLAEEGINASLAGVPEAVRAFQAELPRLLGLEGSVADGGDGPDGIDPEARLDFKESYSSTVPFQRMFVKLKKEIIPIGDPTLRPSVLSGKRLEPRELKQWLDEGRDLTLLDTRNEYEIAHGTFKDARTLGLRHFREIPAKLAELPRADKPVVMFCTGGIRCEKATAVALRLGIRDVYQLEGGILRYFKDCGRAHYEGECFVFDERVTVAE